MMRVVPSVMSDVSVEAHPDDGQRHLNFYIIHMNLPRHSSGNNAAVFFNASIIFDYWIDLFFSA